jgi:chromosome segregation ATPase
MIGSELARLEKRGFFHADLRPWNVLINEGVPSLIDFGALTRRKRLRVYEDYASLCLWIASDCWRTPLEWLSRIDSIDPFSRGILLAVARANNRDLSFEWLLSAALGSVSIEPRAGRIELSDDFVWSSAENFRRLEAGRRIIERSRAQAVKHAQALEGLVAQKDVYARSLEQQVAALQKSAANQLAAVARERDDGLAQLRALQVAVEAKDADLAAMQGALMQAQSKLEKISAHAGALEQAIRQKDDYARVLLGEIERKQQDAAAQIRELVRERDDGAAQVAALNAAIGQKDAEIADLAAYVAGATRDRDLVLADLAAARDELEAVTDEVAKACRSFDRETHTVWQADEPDDENAVHSGNMVDEARSLFAERSAQRRASRSLGLELDRAFAAARDLVERKSLRIDELNAQCSALTTEIQSVREQLQLTECRFADLRARLAEHWLFKLTGLPKALK